MHVKLYERRGGRESLPFSAKDKLGKKVASESTVMLMQCATGLWNRLTKSWILNWIRPAGLLLPLMAECFIRVSLGWVSPGLSCFEFTLLELDQALSQTEGVLHSSSMQHKEVKVESKMYLLIESQTCFIFITDWTILHIVAGTSMQLTHTRVNRGQVFLWESSSWTLAETL